MPNKPKVPKKPKTVTPTPEAPVNTVPDFAIIDGTVYRASAINSVDPITEDNSVKFALGSRIVILAFTEKEEATKTHRLLTYLMTGTDLYAQPAAQPQADAEAKHQEETGA